MFDSFKDFVLNLPVSAQIALVVLWFIGAFFAFECYKTVMKIWRRSPPQKTIYLIASFIISLVIPILFFRLYSQISPIAFNFVLIGAIFAVIIWLCLLSLYSQAKETFGIECAKTINVAVKDLHAKDENGAIILLRLVALLALERVAQENIRHHIQIMKILCTYIRTNSPRTDETDKQKIPEPSMVNALTGADIEIREDIQMALNIIAQRENWPRGKAAIIKEKKQRYRLDLYGCCLYGAKLEGANLSDAILENTDLRNAILKDADLCSAMFYNANLSKAYLKDANLTYARLYKAELSNANLNNAILINTEFQKANLTDASLEGASLRNVYFWANMKNASTSQAYIHKGDLSESENLTQEQIDEMFCGADVEIPEGLTRPKHWPTKKLSYKKFMKAYDEWKEEDNEKRHREFIESYEAEKNAKSKKTAKPKRNDHFTPA